MRDEDFGQFLPLLRRIIILVAVITAIPVVLWTITAFVRTYVMPPKLPTFHQLASRASINEPAPANANVGQAAPERAALAVVTPVVKPADTAPTPAPATLAAAATAPIDAAPKGPFLGDHAPETVAKIQPAAAALAPPAMSAPTPVASKIAETAPAAATDSKPVQTNTVPAVTAMATGPASADRAPVSVAVQLPAPATETPPEALPAAAPLAGPVPLPRRRPHIIAEATAAEPATETTSTRTRLASNGPIPMPRPRPESAGPGAPAESSGGPLDFITNIFGGSK